MTLDEYLYDMDLILESKKSIYKSLNIDLYLYGICLQKKNQLLRHAFTVFLAGLTLAVICFIILRIAGPPTLGVINWY
jgi:hypothetical protein